MVGKNYYWWGNNANISVSDQTDGQGIVKLSVPEVPMEVTADLSVPGILPQNETTAQAAIGGQKINVTVYWQPMSVELSGSALIIPPQTSASITLQYQPSAVNYYPPPYATPGATGPGAPTTPASAATTSETSDQPPSSQGQSAPATRISPFSTATSRAKIGTFSQPSTTTAASRNGGCASDLALLGLDAAAAAVAVVATIFVARARPKH